MSAVVVNSDSKRYIMLSSSPDFRGVEPINDHKTAIVFRNLSKIKLDTFPSVASAILGHAKAHMANEIYGSLLPALGTGTRILYTDTDSALFFIPGMSHEEAINAIQHRLDFSNYPPSHPLYSNERQSVPGYWKDEARSQTIFSYASPREKVYSFKTVDMKTLKENVPFAICFDSLDSENGPAAPYVNVTRRCKGLARSSAASLTHQMYIDCVNSFDKTYSEVVSIRNKKFRLHTQRERRVALYGACVKRRLLHCGLHTKAYRDHVEPRDDSCHECACYEPRLTNE